MAIVDSYLLEDGVESNNTWDGNLAVRSEPVERLIDSGEGGAQETDNRPSNFWITNPTNTFINNAAAGGAFSGYWFQMPPKVLGPSALFPEARGLRPIAMPLTLFKDNTGHSSPRVLTTYPIGYRPPADPPSKIQSFRAWKAQLAGIFIRGSNNLVVDGAQLADNLIGVRMDLSSNIRVMNSVVVGETENLGNPDCPNSTVSKNPCPNNYCPDVSCVPVTGCKMPVNVTTTAARSTADFRYRDSAGIYFTGFSKWKFGNDNLPDGSHVSNTQISRFPTACNVSRAAIIVTSYLLNTNDTKPALGWSTTNSIKNITFDSMSVPVRILPTFEPYGPFQDTEVYQGPMGDFLTLWDEDGCVTKKGPGFLVKDTPGFGASSATNTTAGGFANCEKSMRVIGGLSCPRACYRTVLIYWKSSSPLPFNPTGPRTLRFTRAVDNAVVEVIHKVSAGWYWTTVNLLARQTYRVDYLVEGSNGTFPGIFNVGFFNDGVRTCDGGLTLMFAPPAGFQFTVLGELGTGTCTANLMALDPPSTAQSYTCFGGKPHLQLSLQSNDTRVLDLGVVPGMPQKCNSCPMPPKIPPPPPAPLLPPPPPASITIAWEVGVNVTVSIPLGRTVTFFWEDTIHSVAPTNQAASMALGMGAGKRTRFADPPFAVTVPFYFAGTCTFECGVHGSQMTAGVIVV